MKAYKGLSLAVLATFLVSVTLFYLAGQTTETFTGVELAGIAGQLKVSSVSNYPEAVVPLAEPQAAQPLSKEQIYDSALLFTAEVWITLEDGSRAPATGIIVGSGHDVLTNAHVIAGNPSPTIRVRDAYGGETDYPGQVVAVDRDKDMALIAIAGAPSLPVAKFAESTTAVKVGDKVYILGSPVGFHWKISEGEVIELESQCGLPQLHCIRTAAGGMHPGNSGGPLLDESGEVIGVNRAIQQSTGQGVSIPIEQVREFLSTNAIS